MVRIAIVDDETAAVQLLRGYVERYAREHDLPVTVTEFRDGLSFISDYNPVFDLIYFLQPKLLKQI